MDTPILTNKDEFPTDEVIFSHLGKTKSYWISLFDLIRSNYTDFAEEWKFYKDGNSWLLKITRKKKTVCWISIYKNKFKMTFYFTDKAESTIMESSISEDLKEHFKTGKYFNKIRGLTITFSKKEDIKFAITLIEIKLKIK